jgi:hypothetical protein
MECNLKTDAAFHFIPHKQGAALGLYNYCNYYGEVNRSALSLKHELKGTEV